jgi:uncharacterized protein (TIGR03066 family)
MRPMLLVGMVLTVLSLPACSSKTELSNAEKIIGAWVVSKPAKDTPKDTALEFTKDGKLVWTGSLNGIQTDIEGQYKVEGDKIVSTRDIGGHEDRRTIKIKSLTDTTLVIEMPEGHVDEYKKK